VKRLKFLNKTRRPRWAWWNSSK